MTYEELQQITEAEQQAAKEKKHTLKVCVAAGCVSSRSDKLVDALKAELKEVADSVNVILFID